MGQNSWGEVSLKVVGFSLRIKDREELKLIRQRIEDGMFQTGGISEQGHEACSKDNRFRK